MIADKNGVPVYEEEEISRAISGYYSDLFESGCVDGQPKIVEALQPCISDAQNERLIVMPHANEIKEAAFAINADKALGPDGFQPFSFSPTGGHRASGGEEDPAVLLNGYPHTNTNAQQKYVRLIPKITGVQKVKDYRPISLCNIFYKIISKLMSLRLKTFLGSIIYEYQ